MTWEKHADEAARLEAIGDDQQWGAAEEYARAAENGTQKDIASRVGKSETHVSFMVYLGKSPELRVEGLSFAEAYAAAKKKRPVEHNPVDINPVAGIYTTVVVDPPWQYDNRGTRGAAADHYPQMSVEELVALAIPAGDEAHLYLWTTNAFLRDAFRLVDAWNFDYKATLAWVKPQMGMGNYFRISHELVLFAVRGGLKIPPEKRRVSWFEAPRGKHSAKPDAFYELVESCSPGPYMDMFNRDGGKMFHRPGWDGWGNEA